MTHDSARRGGLGSGGASRALVVIGVLILAALIGVIVALVMLLNREEPTPTPTVVQEETGARSVLVTEENAEEVVEDMLEPPGFAPTSYEVSMTTDWVFPDGASPSTNAYVENLTNNETPVYFDILLRDTDEVIYESPVIPLGGVLENFKLDKDLDAGSYECVMVYHLIDDAQRTLSRLRVGLSITVES